MFHLGDASERRLRFDGRPFVPKMVKLSTVKQTGNMVFFTFASINFLKSIEVINIDVRIFSGCDKGILCWSHHRLVNCAVFFDCF